MKVVGRRLVDDATVHRVVARGGHGEGLSLEARCRDRCLHRVGVEGDRSTTATPRTDVAQSPTPNELYLNDNLDATSSHSQRAS